MNYPKRGWSFAAISFRIGAIADARWFSVIPTRYPKIAEKVATSQAPLFWALAAAKNSPFIAPLATLLIGPGVIYNPVDS